MPSTVVIEQGFHAAVFCPTVSYPTLSHGDFKVLLQDSKEMAHRHTKINCSSLYLSLFGFRLVVPSVPNGKVQAKNGYRWIRI
jgi:hypothetical protein